MRLNKFLALGSGLSRRSADKAIDEGRVDLNNHIAVLGEQVLEGDHVKLDGASIKLPYLTTTLMLNKPVGYVCSRNGQGSLTIYDLLPPEYHKLKTAGRLDKDSSGLVILTDNGDLAESLTHPRFQKDKIYNVKLNKTLEPKHESLIKKGVKLDDGVSKLALSKLDQDAKRFKVTMQEGRNRQIRRSFETLGYNIVALERLEIGQYKLDRLPTGQFKLL
jgi:23S rRNA pseudouridine2605 synthase